MSLLNIKIFYPVAALLLLASCSSTYVISPWGTNVDNVEHITVFFDGTANTEASHTNVLKLYQLTSLQGRDNIKSIYIRGVGTDGGMFKKSLGMGMGLGLGEDVKIAYKHVADNYQRNGDVDDKIYLFGFSRGSYSARVLAGLIKSSGVPDFTKLSDKTHKKYKEKIIDGIYKKYKGNKPIDERRYTSATVTFNHPDIEFMGLWDTVEALGIPDRKEHFAKVNPKYLDQLCNVKKAAHAMSADDNRARIFTPILLTYDGLVSDCTQKNIDDIVDEVWFSGAHSDVGGGYEDTDLSGVSLNWMIERIPEGLFKVKPVVYEDALGLSHNPSTGIFRILYWNLNRNIPYYMDNVSYNGGVPKIHSSVVKRLAFVNKQWQEFDWSYIATKEKYKDNYPHCFTKRHTPKDHEDKPGECHSSHYLLDYVESPEKPCFEIVETTLKSDSKIVKQTQN